MSETLESIIRKTQEKNQDSFHALLSRFDRLLKKQATKLRYDDAYNDLVLDFINIIRNIDLRKICNTSDGALVLYIHKAVLRTYYKRQAKNELYAEIPFSNLSDREIRQVHDTAYLTGGFTIIELALISSALSETEREVLELMFHLGYAASEIASIRGVSRQAVNQTKNRAIKKLKQQYGE